MKKSNEEKRVVIYCRESRDDYGENYERIETQRDLLVKYCKSHGYTNIVDIIMDDDKSGTDFSRFDDIRKRAKNKEIDIIVFKNSARLGRNQKEALDFVEYLEEQGVEIIFEDEQYNEEMFGLYAWFNERRARDDSKNIRRNLRHKIEEGDLLVKAIYGYNKDGKRLVINEETAPVVLHLDNDKAGISSASAIKIALSTSYNVINNPPLYGKDYNDYLFDDVRDVLLKLSGYKLAICTLSSRDMLNKFIFNTFL